MTFIDTERTFSAVEPKPSKFRLFLSFLTVTVATSFQDRAPEMMWDAGSYLSGSMALISRGSIYEAGGLVLRGAWTPVVYSPAAAVNQIFRNGEYGEVLYTAVLLQGALLVATISVFLLPTLMQIWFPRNSTSLIVCTLLGYFALKSFAPYSLMDLWAVALVLLAVCLLTRPKFANLFFAGLALGICVNIRPSYLLTVVAVAVASVAYTRFRGLIVLASLIVAQIPQLAVNIFINQRISLFPVDLRNIARQDLDSAIFVIRYDTIAYRPWAQGAQLFCDPTMTRIALNGFPSSPLDFIKFFLTHPVESGWFYIQKLGAVLLWPTSTPYFELNPSPRLFFGVIILLITTLGISSLVLTRTNSSALNLPRVATIIVIVCALVGFATSHTETRYAVPLVLIGIVGIAGFVGQSIRYGFHRSNIRGGIPTAVAVAAIAVLLAMAGNLGLKNADSCPTVESIKNAQTIP